MFTRVEYKDRLKEIKLSKDQIDKLRNVIEEMMMYAGRKSNVKDAPETFVYYYEGKADGLNAMDRFLRGDMDVHDEFEDV